MCTSNFATWFDTFSRALDIRVQYELERNREEADRALERVFGSQIYGFLEQRHYEYTNTFKEWAYDRVMANAVDDVEETIHPLLAPVTELVDAWSKGKRYRAEDQFERGRVREQQERAANIENKVQLKDWLGLGLPSPLELLTDLKNGKSRTVEGHDLTPDEHGVWVTNPYGLDCGLWQDINVEFIESFLTDMARGEEYGLVPD